MLSSIAHEFHVYMVCKEHKLPNQAIDFVGLLVDSSLVWCLHFILFSLISFELEFLDALVLWRSIQWVFHGPPPHSELLTGSRPLETFLSAMDIFHVFPK